MSAPQPFVATPLSRHGHPAFAAPALAISAALLAAPVARAAQYELSYGVEASGEVNDNVNLNPDPIEVVGGVVALPVSLSRETELSEVALDAEASFYRYDQEAYDSNNQNLQGRYRRTLERGEFEGHAGFLRDSTRDSEFLDTGLVGPSATRRETLSLGASGSRLFTERNGVSGGFAYQDVSYATERFQPFQYTTAYAGWIHQGSSRTQWRVQAYLNRFENDAAPISVSSEGLGAQGGLDTQLSERLSLSLLAGWVSVDTGYDAGPGFIAPPGNSDDSYLVDGQLKWRDERGQWTLGLSSEPFPSAIGVLLNSTRLNLNWRYQVSERATFGVSGDAGTQTAQDPRVNQDRDFAGASLRFDYRLTPAWYLGARYNYRWQDTENFAEATDGNAAFLSLRYAPTARRWSR